MISVGSFLQIMYTQSPPVMAAIKNCRKTPKILENKMLVTRMVSSMTHLDKETPALVFLSNASYYNHPASSLCLSLCLPERQQDTYNLNQSSGKHLKVWCLFWSPHVLHYRLGIYNMLSSMSLPAKTASVPMMHTAINTQSRMWSKTMATNFHSSAAWNKTWGRVLT